jgi:hypothetical protein
MSILAKLKQQNPEKKMFAVIAGPRLGGKTTLAGTLPGKTLLLQAAILESGSKSAARLAERLGNELTIVHFNSVDELVSVIKELAEDKEYDHVFIDGLSGITEMKYKEPKIAAAIRKNTWDGFRDLGDAAGDVIEAAKSLTYTDRTKHAKTVWITCALRVEEKNNSIDVELDTKGKKAVSSITKLGEAVLTVLPSEKTENGETGHRLVTKTSGPWPGRIDGLLADQNPGVIQPASLADVLNLVYGAKK